MQIKCCDRQQPTYVICRMIIFNSSEIWRKKLTIRSLHVKFHEFRSIPLGIPNWTIFDYSYKNVIQWWYLKKKEKKNGTIYPTHTDGDADENANEISYIWQMWIIRIRIRNNVLKPTYIYNAIYFVYNAKHIYYTCIKLCHWEDTHP